MTRWKDAAENHVIHVSKNMYQCPACAEETLWKHGADDFIAGAEHGAKVERERVLALLKSDEATDHILVPSIGSSENKVMARWLEDKLREEDRK